MKTKFDLTNPAIVKLCLLCEGVRIEEAVLKEVGRAFAEDRFRYHRVSKIPKGFEVVPSEIVLPEDIVCAVFIEEKSPWLIKYNKKGEIRLFYQEQKEICPVSLTKRPKFFERKLSSGHLCRQIAVMYGNYVLALFIMGWCYYPAQKLGCKFCSIGSNWGETGLGRQNLKFVTPKIAQEAVKIAIEEEGQRIKYVMYSSGSFPNNDRGFKTQTEVVKEIKKVTADRACHHFTIMPPDDFSLIKEIKDAGLSTMAFDIEVFDKRRFEELCPGKEKFYGYDKFLEVLEYAVKIFGWSNIHCGFVAGLESLETMIEGFYYLGKKGVVSDANVFHPDPGSELENKARPCKEYVYKMAVEQAKVYKRYNLISIFPIGGRRGSLDTEVYKGYFG